MRFIRMRSLRLAMLAAGLSIAGASSALAQLADRFEGTLNVVWGDPRHGAAGGEMRFSVSLANGTTYALHLSPAQQSGAVFNFGKPVVVHGQLTAGLHGAQEISAQSIEAAHGAGQETARHAPTRRVLYLLLKFQGDSQEPHDPSFYLAMTNPKQPNAGLSIPATINGFFSKTSWNNLQWRADVSQWMTLPHPKTFYANCGWDTSCADINAISNDGFALAVSAGIDLSRYDNINFVLNNDLDCCAWGGGTSFNGRSYGATWEPPWGQETGTYAHEFGHSIGLPHSGWTYYSYDSPWDIMSDRTASSFTQCSTYFSDNDNANRAVYCTEPGDGYIAAHKDYLGWIPLANQVVVNGPMTVRVKLEANAAPLGTGIKMVKICLSGASCTGSSAHYLTVEARIGGKLYENGLTGDGVIIQDFKANRGAIGGTCYFNTQSGFVVPIDATPGDWDGVNCDSNGATWPDYALGNAQFTPGQTYTDNTLHVSVQVKRKKGQNYVISVTRTQ